MSHRKEKNRGLVDDTSFTSFIHSEAMKTHLLHFLLLTQILDENIPPPPVCAELKLLTEGQSLRLSCTPQQGLGPLRGLHLYHHGGRAQTTLLSVAESGAVRVDPGRGARLQLSGGLSSAGVKVSVSPLQPSDSGLYVWELSYRERNGSDLTVLRGNKTLLLVEGRACSCSQRHISLLLTLSAAAVLLLLAFSWMLVEKCIKASHRPALQPHSPIYEEMSRKAQPPASPKNIGEPPPHLQEVNFPVYANPDIIQQPQDNYYACPRKPVTLTGHDITGTPHVFSF